MYATSVFSWEPSGDSPTRRAFYDSWMLGCIPIVVDYASYDYEQLFRGLLYRSTGIAFNETALVVDGATFTNGEKLFARIAGMSSNELERRRANMRTLAPYMQVHSPQK